MIRARLLIGIVLTATLGSSGCTTYTIPYKESTIVQAVSADTGIHASSITQHAHCRMGHALPGQPELVMDECVYVATAAWAALLHYDVKAKRYHEVVRIDLNTPGIAFKTHKHLIGTAGQLQIKEERGYLVVDFFLPGAGMPGSDDGLLEAFAAIKAFGVPEIPGRDYVRPYQKPDPVTIRVPVSR